MNERVSTLSLTFDEAMEQIIYMLCDASHLTVAAVLTLLNADRNRRGEKTIASDNTLFLVEDNNGVLENGIS